MSPDPSQLYYADPTNPQSFNLYSYALNNPLKFTDPTGLYCYYGDTDYSSAQGQADQNNATQWDFHSNSGECGSNGGQWFNDAETHTDWYGTSWDNAGRHDFGVSAISDASPQSQVQYTSTGPVPCDFCLDPNFNYAAVPKYSISARKIPPPPPAPGGFECAGAPTENMAYHELAMQIWRKDNLIPSPTSRPSDDDTGGEGIGANRTVTASGQGAKFYVGNNGVDMKPFASQLAPNANLQGAAGSNSVAMAADYAVSATGCALSK